jgi:hypothetical protein
MLTEKIEKLLSITNTIKQIQSTCQYISSLNEVDKNNLVSTIYFLDIIRINKADSNNWAFLLNLNCLLKHLFSDFFTSATQNIYKLCYFLLIYLLYLNFSFISCFIPHFTYNLFTLLI